MTAAGVGTEPRPRAPAGPDRQPELDPAVAARDQRRLRRRVTAVWVLLFVNVLTPRPDAPGLLPISKSVGQVVTGACLAGAFVLALGLNRRMAVRSNVVLGLTTVLAVTALIASLRGLAGFGSLLRGGRLFGFLAVLWLLTPWWGRRDLLIARAHLRALLYVCGSVLVGLVVAPGLALSGGGGHRLIGVLWAIPAPQVAEYAALVAGMAASLWATGRLSSPAAAVAVVGGTAMVVASQTRTALVALVVGTAAAALVTYCARRRVRRAVAVAVAVLPLLVLGAAPLAARWFQKGQSSAEIAGLTGRRQVWDALLAEPRSTAQHWFGSGLSDKSFDGLSIDSTWLAVYRDEGLVGVGIVALTLGYLLAAASRHPDVAQRSLAMFLTVYCTVASYTEVGLGDASPYLLSVVAAASLVTLQSRSRRPV